MFHYSLSPNKRTGFTLKSITHKMKMVGHNFHNTFNIANVFISLSFVTLLWLSGLLQYKYRPQCGSAPSADSHPLCFQPSMHKLSVMFCLGPSVRKRESLVLVFVLVCGKLSPGQIGSHIVLEQPRELQGLLTVCSTRQPSRMLID